MLPPFLRRAVNKVALNHALVGTIVMKTQYFHLTMLGGAAIRVYASLHPSHQYAAGRPCDRAGRPAGQAGSSLGAVRSWGLCPAASEGACAVRAEPDFRVPRLQMHSAGVADRAATPLKCYRKWNVRRSFRHLLWWPRGLVSILSVCPPPVLTERTQIFVLIRGYSLLTLLTKGVSPPLNVYLRIDEVALQRFATGFLTASAQPPMFDQDCNRLCGIFT